MGTFPVLLSSCSSDQGNEGGGGGERNEGGAEGTEDHQWELIQLPDTFCADGSPYKFFVKWAKESENLAITLEPGGGCWSYETCTGPHVHNLNGLRDDRMSAFPPPLGNVEGAIPWGLMFPHLGESDEKVATKDYQQVYFPYCTADAFLGDVVVEYRDEDKVLEIQHRGAHNLRVAEGWLKQNFSGVEHLLITGASAGGLGATINYAFLRDAINPKRASLLNDSGPLFPPGGPQTQARQAFVERWDSQGLLNSLDKRLNASDGNRLTEDSGNINRLLVEAFPSDRFLVTHFMRDLNYSLFSYAEFFEELSAERVYQLWEQDTALLVDELKSFDNWGYFFPGFRVDGCSHTVSVLPVAEFSNLPYILEARSGTADGYLRTDLGEADFGDALLSTISKTGELIGAQEPTPKSTLSEEEVAACWRGFN